MTQLKLHQLLTALIIRYHEIKMGSLTFNTPSFELFPQELGIKSDLLLSDPNFDEKLNLLISEFIKKVPDKNQLFAYIARDISFLKNIDIHTTTHAEISQELERILKNLRILATTPQEHACAVVTSDNTELLLSGLQESPSYAKDLFNAVCSLTNATPFSLPQHVTNAFPGSASSALICGLLKRITDLSPSKTKNIKCLADELARHYLCPEENISLTPETCEQTELMPSECHLKQATPNPHQNTLNRFVTLSLISGGNPLLANILEKSEHAEIKSLLSHGASSI